MKQIILLFACLFALQGLAKADDDRAITVDQLPQKAQEFIQKYFPKNEISLAKMEKDFWEKKYEVVFVNGEKAEFLQPSVVSDTHICGSGSSSFTVSIGMGSLSVHATGNHTDCYHFGRNTHCPSARRHFRHAKPLFFPFLSGTVQIG